MVGHMRILRLLLVSSLPLLISAAAPKAHTDVTITDGRFTPASVSIAVGDTVVWTNDSDHDHTVEADDGSFDSGKIKAGKTFEHKFTKAGTYAYSCSLHPREKGKVIVKK